MRYNLNDMSKSDTVEIVNSEHYPTYLRGISEIRRDKRFFDIKLCIEDKEIDSHKTVLAAFSPYFSEHFDDDFLKSRQDKINVKVDTNMAVLASVLDYMYSGSISFLIEDGAMLMRTLDFFQMPSVKDLCVTYLVDNIDAENYVAVFNLGEEVPLESLKEAAVDYINKNFVEIHGSDEIKNLTKDQFESVIKKTRDEYAKITYQAVVGWIKHDPSNRNDYVEQLLKYVSIKNLTASYYWENIRKEEFLKSNDAGRRWLLDSFLDHPESPLIKPSYQTLHIFSNSDNSNLGLDVRDKSLRTHESRPELNCYAMVKHSRSIYAFGKRRENDIGNIGLEFNTTANEWTQFVASYIFINPSPGICSNGDAIYFVGGLAFKQGQKICLRYDVETSQWTTLPDMQHARSSPGVVSYNQSIYVFGGYSDYREGTINTSVERYDDREGKWFTQGHNNLQLSVSSAVVSDYNIYCLECNSDRVINFDPRSSSYTHVTPQKGTSLASLDGRVYIAHEGGIAEYNPHALSWNELLVDFMLHWDLPILIA